MKLTTKSVKEIERVPWGLWLWQMPDGSFVSDGEDRFLNLPGTKNDPNKPRILREFVKSEFGITEGRPFYKTGQRQVTDEEYEEQKSRMVFGLTPDPLDIAEAREDIINANGR